MINYVLAPSILAADFKVLGQEMKKTEDNGAEYIPLHYPQSFSFPDPKL